MNCSCCGEKLKERDILFINTLSEVEQERVKKLAIEKNCCDRCQTDILLLTALQSAK